MTQILGSVLAAVSATVVASYFGVAGTVIGAALGSLVSVVGGAIYTHSMNRTRDKIKTKAIESAVAQRFGTAEAVRTPLSRARDAGDDLRSRLFAGPAGRRLVLSTAALFVVVLGAVTAFEMVSGKPLSATVTAQHGSGTSLSGGHHSTVQLPVAPTSQPSHTGHPPATVAPSSPASTSHPSSSHASTSGTTTSGKPTVGTTGSVTSSVPASKPPAASSLLTSAPVQPPSSA